MTNYHIRIKVRKGHVKEILDRLQKAQQTIYECYIELEELGVLTVVEEAASETDGPMQAITRSRQSH